MNRVIQGKCLDTPFLIFFLRGNPTGFQSVLLNRANNWIQTEQKPHVILGISNRRTSST